MEIRRIASDLLSSNMYLLVEGDRAVVIDPCRDTSMAAGLFIDRILLTHEHYDHISGVNAWKEATGAGVLCSEACAAGIGNPKRNMARYFTAFSQMQTWVEVKENPEVDETYACTAEETFEDRTSFEWMGHHFELFAMPGHSRGSIGILVDGEAFFSGDSCLEGKEIETGFPGGDLSLWESIGKKRLAELPEGIRVYPGHFGVFRLVREVRGEESCPAGTVNDN